MVAFIANPLEHADSVMDQDGWNILHLGINAVLLFDKGHF